MLSGETTKATAWKRVAENKQRADEKTRNDAWSAKSGKPKPESDIEAGWTPVWFQLTKDHNKQDFWVLNEENNYWKKRDQALQDGKEPKEVLKAKQIIGTAAEFPEYHQYQDMFAAEYKQLDGKPDDGGKLLLVVPSDNKETKSCDEVPHHHKGTRLNSTYS